MVYARSGAPGELGELEALCNSARLLYTEDALITSASAAAWLREQGRDLGEPNRKEHDLLVTLRETVREHLAGTSPEASATTLNRIAKSTVVGIRWSPEGEPVLPPKRPSGVETYVAELLGALFTAGLSGELDKLKVCRNPACRYVFYDRSPAQNSVWCSMDICGARNKMRTYRSRHVG
ncbi:CGNR zinc finger domain-containing protein [Prauserella cavernicola]|uniref:CGNR zinc finger domain-containing protein n=1 Tax=Prauserella cavernicola TaxID=2800127 RepID=A0A934QXS1_9PSEU|nr:CGNR zinc finger domain-containing protein [Prauserella cavernicola]MBK1788421.1 CGNR zinc finger domain-containing protein [Prauserella cavernicola]